jgi:hypothetical protein
MDEARSAVTSGLERFPGDPELSELASRIKE